MSFLATGMDLEVIMLCKVSQIEKDKYMILFTCRILKNDTDEFIYKTGTDLDFMVTGVGEGWQRRNRFGVWDWYVYTVTFQIDSSKYLLYSTGNSAQYSVMT